MKSEHPPPPQCHQLVASWQFTLGRIRTNSASDPLINCIIYRSCLINAAAERTISPSEEGATVMSTLMPHCCSEGVGSLLPHIPAPHISSLLPHPPLQPHASPPSPPQSALGSFQFASQLAAGFPSPVKRRAICCALWLMPRRALNTHIKSVRLNRFSFANLYRTEVQSVSLEVYTP